VLTDAVDKCLAKEPSERFASAGEFVSALEGAQSFAPDIPMPIRLFTQEVGTLGSIAFFAVLTVWMLVTVIKTRNDSDDVFIPVVLLVAVLLGRLSQTLLDARRLVRHGFPRSEIVRGMQAVVNERETRRIQLRNDAATRRMRRMTVLAALFMIGSAAVLIRLAMNFRFPAATGGYYVTLPGAVMFICGLLEIGFGLPLLLRSPLRMPMTERVFRMLWLGPIGRGFFRLASLGLNRSEDSKTRRRITVGEPGSRKSSPVAKILAATTPAAPPTAYNENGTHDARLAAIEQRIAVLEQSMRKG
jgi:hypothetical protein